MALEEMIAAYPKLTLFVFSFVVMLISTLIHKYFTDQEHLHNQRKRQKELQKELKGVKDPKKVAEINAELLKIMGGTFRHSMKPLFITFIPFLLLFLWLRGVYDPIMGGSWFWWYFGFAMASSIVLRKLFKVA